ncbi:unnamed protein product [Aureobasidium vineae]|uniref:Uncharacterized protein n=1 Tax=Aureobasidium vineae TaxID=2773715 RepID=A0A9N8JSI4_9PEZI|nr:unnamed protein product [Aureobasidium vineae]
MGETFIDTAAHSVIYEKDHSTNPPGHQAKPRSYLLSSQIWLNDTRWHHLFHRFAAELPQLGHFAINHSHDDTWAYEHADALSTALKVGRYAIFCETYWLSFSNYQPRDFVFREWEEDKKNRIQIQEPGCDDEDWEALTELLERLRRSRLG